MTVQPLALQGQTTATITLRSRHEHGGHPVREVEGGYAVDWPTGTEVYGSRRALIRALYSGGDGSVCVHDPGVSFSRYFGLRKEVPQPTCLLDLLDVEPTDLIQTQPRETRRSKLTVTKRSRLRRKAKLVVEAPWWEDEVVVGGTRPLKPGSWVRSSGKPSKLTVAKPKRRKKKAKLTVVAEPEEPKLGIDLAERGHEVRKLFYAGFRKRVMRLGYDIEDVLQEVYRGILARNIGKCPFDARKSSFGHYVHIVIECILRNYMRKQRRVARHETVGCYSLTDDGWGMVDAATVAAETSYESMSAVEENLSIDLAMETLAERVMDTGRPEASLAVMALPHVREGCQRRDVIARIKEETGEIIKPSECSKALSLLRKVSRSWAQEQGLR